MPFSFVRISSFYGSCIWPSGSSGARRAQLVCDTPDSLRDENRYLERVFHKNNYNADFIRRNIYRPAEADATNRNPTPVTIVTIP